MLVVHVHIRVKPEHLDGFLTETRRNAAASLEEPGVRRFDVLPVEADETHLVLGDVYADQAAADAHKQTSHYARWQAAVAEMLTEPRTRIRFTYVQGGTDRPVRGVDHATDHTGEAVHCPQLRVGERDPAERAGEGHLLPGRGIVAALVGGAQGPGGTLDPWSSSTRRRRGRGPKNREAMSAGPR